MAGGDESGVVSQAALARFDRHVRAALRRRTASEGKLAGALRALSPLSASLRACQLEALSILIKRQSFERELYASAIRSVAEAGERKAVPLLVAALGTDSAGGLSTLSAAGASRDPELAPLLERWCVNRAAHLAFAAEIARMARGESRGSLLAALAPKLKESHRVAICSEVLLPLTRSAPLPPSACPALEILADSERHLGRWLVIAEVAARAGASWPVRRARDEAASGPASSRAAWSLVAWALEPAGPPPTARPTAEVVARLSERPTADRDMTFLFRMALARVPSARPMLESLAKADPWSDEISIRAAMHLARDHGRSNLADRLVETSRRGKRPELRAVAAAALWDLGERQPIEPLLADLAQQEPLSALSWAALIEWARRRATPGAAVLCEPTFRRVEYGWVA